MILPCDRTPIEMSSRASSETAVTMMIEVGRYHHRIMTSSIPSIHHQSYHVLHTATCHPLNSLATDHHNHHHHYHHHHYHHHTSSSYIIIHHHHTSSYITIIIIHHNHHRSTAVAMELELIFYRYGSFPSSCVGPVAIMNAPFVRDHDSSSSGSSSSNETDVEVLILK